VIAMTKITIGGNEQTIQPFSAAKAIEAGALMSDIVQHGNELFEAMDAYARKHMQTNTIRIPRAAAFYRDPDAAGQVPADAWEASGNQLELPGPQPTFEQQLLAVFPQLFKLCRGQVLALLALVVVDERELEQVDQQGGPDGVTDLLAREGRRLLYRARMEELLTLAQAAWDVCREQLAADPTAQALLNRLLGLRTSARTGSSSEPGSSTGSPQRTGGPAKRSSTGSRGKSSTPSTASSPSTSAANS
jgi:hypothetical protein